MTLVQSEDSSPQCWRTGGLVHARLPTGFTQAGPQACLLQGYLVVAFAELGVFLLYAGQDLFQLANLSHMLGQACCVVLGLCDCFEKLTSFQLELRNLLLQLSYTLQPTS